MKIHPKYCILAGGYLANKEDGTWYDSHTKRWGTVNGYTESDYNPIDESNFEWLDAGSQYYILNTIKQEFYKDVLS